MFLKNILFISLSFFCLPFFSQSNKSVEKLKKIVYTLSNDSLLGRGAGSAGEEKAKNYLVHTFRKIKLDPFNNSYTQQFIFPKDTLKTDTSYNVTGFINNNADSTIIIGAHYDHLGMGGTKSRSFTSANIHPGADDNASGIALILILAEYLKKSENKKFNFLFIAFGSHENGLYGSRAFFEQQKFKLPKIKLMLNFDMLGRLAITNSIVKVTRQEKAKPIDLLLNKTAHEKFQLNIEESNSSLSDATVFSRHNIPAVTFTTGIHDDYHKISDVAEKINFAGIQEIEQYIENLMHELCKP